MFKVWIAKEANFEAEKEKQEKNQLLLKIAELEQAKETVEQERDKITDMETQRKYHLDKDADRRKAQDRIKELEKRIANIEDTKSREVTNIRMNLEGKCRSLANLQKEQTDELRRELDQAAEDKKAVMVKIGQLETEKVELQAVVASQNNVADEKRAICDPPERSLCAIWTC